MCKQLIPIHLLSDSSIEKQVALLKALYGKHFYKSLFCYCECTCRKSEESLLRAEIQILDNASLVKVDLYPSLLGVQLGDVFLVRKQVEWPNSYYVRPQGSQSPEFEFVAHRKHLKIFLLVAILFLSLIIWLTFMALLYFSG